MDGIHDLGGKHGFGAVVREPGEPVFHAKWEARVFAVMRGLGGVAVASSDHFRHGIERILPEAYLRHGYYGRWLGGLETLAIEAGVVDAAAIEARMRERGVEPSRCVAAGAAVRGARPPALDRAPLGRGAARALAAPPRFALGDRVRTSRFPVPGHTRLPAYARGRVGAVVALHGGWVFPDDNAHGRGESPCHLYTVAFAGEELWGTTAEPNAEVRLDLFEPYLHTAGGSA